jgi:glyoxylase-like metal-dependent hydrolase (beta-lactamase superfamily II)
MTRDPLPLTAHNAGPLTGLGTTTWLCDGPEPTLVDAGVGHAAHVEAVAAALAGRPLARVLVTHGHPDHASGLPALRARWPALEIARWPDPHAPAESQTQLLSEGMRIRAGSSDLLVLHTPGHAPDHVCFWNEHTRDLFAGDMVLHGTTVMIPAGRGGNLREYLRSLERLAALRPARIFPGHGSVIEQPLALIAEYLAHRRLREQQVLGCLREGITDPDAIVARIYPGLAAEVRPAARLTVDAHLEKLREDGLL